MSRLIYSRDRDQCYFPHDPFFKRWYLQAGLLHISHLHLPRVRFCAASAWNSIQTELKCWLLFLLVHFSLTEIRTQLHQEVRVKEGRRKKKKHSPSSFLASLYRRKRVLKKAARSKIFINQPIFCRAHFQAVKYTIEKGIFGWYGMTHESHRSMWSWTLGRLLIRMQRQENQQKKPDGICLLKRKTPAEPQACLLSGVHQRQFLWFQTSNDGETFFRHEGWSGRMFTQWDQKKWEELLQLSTRKVTERRSILEMTDLMDVHLDTAVLTEKWWKQKQT